MFLRTGSGQQILRGCQGGRAFNLRAGLALALAAFALQTASAQSSRSGWGSTPYHDSSGTGVTFRVWAPNAASVYVTGTFNNWSTTATPLTQERTNNVLDGIWSADVTAATNLSQYKYYLNNNGGFYKHDPRSRWVVAAGTGSGANDIVYDPTVFNWNGDSLTPPAQNDLFIYELHLGTFYTNGSNPFLGATNRLAYLKSLGVNAVELLPVAEFGNSGSSWGYDPAQLFAVDNGQYGGPNGFKSFVQMCHKFGLAVFLDVVHNHYGPSLLDMWNFDGFAGANSVGGGGIYFFQANTNLEITPYGDTRPNFSSQQVYNFIQDNFTLWLGEYHVDGFRWDTPGTMLYANDGSYITSASNLINAVNVMIHTNTGKISIAEDEYNSYGFDSAWDTSYPAAFTPVLTNTVDANRDMTIIANAVMYNVRYGGTAGMGRVAFLESHDVVGDLNNGVRLVTAIDPATPNSYRARKLSTLGSIVTLTAPGVPMIFQGQEMLENQSFDSGRQVDWTKTNTYSRIVQLYRDLISARRDLKGYTPGLKGSQSAMLQLDNNSKLIAFHRWNAATNQDAVVIANFSATTFNNYTLPFPWAGKWYAHLNSDSTNYSSDFGNVGSSMVTATGNPAYGTVVIGPYSALVLSPTPDTPPQLTITSNHGGLNVSWPNTYSEWVLFSSTNLAGTNVLWSQVTNSPYVTNATTISLNTTAGGNLFYRLQAP